MEPPLKRQRLSTTVESEGDLQERRVRNDLQLKSRFETIFEKYSKDFEGIGDEIDMRTGEIVVNNGHILGMANERDVGDFEDTDTFTGGLESGYYSDEDSHSLDGYNGSQNMILGPVNLEDTAAISQAGLDWTSDNDGDSLMGEIEVERQADESLGMTASDLEEDELANSEFEWMNPRHIRAVAHDRWQNRKQQLESLDEPSVDPAWRAPPLPVSTLSLNKTEKASLAGVVDDRGDTDSEVRGVSIWAAGKIEGQRRLFNHQSTPNDQRERHRKSPSDSNNVGLSSLPHMGIREEEDSSRHSKATETIARRDMGHYFPQQNDTRSTEQLLRGAISEIIGPSTATDALIASHIKSSDEHRIHPRESLQEGRTISYSFSPQVMSDGGLSRFAGTHKQNVEQLASFDRLHNGDCKDELEDDSQTNNSISHVMSIARIHKCEEETPSLQAQNEKEDMHIEEHPQQIDRALAAATTAVNVSQNSFQRLEESKCGAGQPRLAVATELHLTEDVHDILKKESAQDLTAHGFDVFSVPNGNSGEHQNGPMDGDPPLSTMFQEATDATEDSQVGTSATPLCRSLTDHCAHVPRLNDTQSTERLAREEGPTAKPGTSNAASEQTLQRTSRSSAKTRIVQVVIPVITTYTAEDTMPTVDIELDKPRTDSKEDNYHSPTRVVGEKESEHQLSNPDLHVDSSMQKDSLSDRDQSVLEDPLCTEVPDSQPWSRSSLILESPGKKGTKAARTSVKFPQRPRPFNKAFDNSIDSPKKDRKKPLKIAVADSISSIPEAMLDCSEDELSFM